MGRKGLLPYAKAGAVVYTWTAAANTATAWWSPGDWFLGKTGATACTDLQVGGTAASSLYPHTCCMAYHPPLTIPDTKACVMKKAFFLLLGLPALAFLGARKGDIPVLETGGQPMPVTWIDRETGHQIIRLSPDHGQDRSFYFHNNPFFPAASGKGWEMLYYGEDRNGHRQLFAVQLEDRTVRQLTQFPRPFSGEILGLRHRLAYVQAGDSVFAVGLDNGKASLVYVFQEHFHGHIASVNADGTLLAGVWSSDQARQILRQYPQKGSYFDRLYDAHIPHVLFTIDLRNRTLTKIDSEATWMNHEQFSPTDPEMLLYAHEGPWHKVDRTWVINVRTREKRLLHKRSVPREINGHEWWAPDGRSVWFDLQIPRSVTFYVAGVDLATGRENRYALQRDEWSIHYNLSPDQELFCGDGGDSTQVARARDGRWIYLFRPRGDSLASEKLVDMRHHRYRALEPNVRFSPDGSWVIFRANFEGRDAIYAVKTTQS